MQAPQGSSTDDLELARSYDSTAAEYDRVAVPNIFTPPAEDLVAMMELPAGGLVLDVGGGTGAVSVPAAKAVGPAGLVVTLDPSVEMLRIARRKGLLWVVAGAAPCLPFVTGRFDGVTVSFVLSHFEDCEEALADIRRVLRSGGRLGVTAWGEGENSFEPAWREIAAGFVGEAFLSNAISLTLPSEERFKKAEGLECMLEAAGFARVDTQVREYRVTLSREDFLATRNASISGRFMRTRLGPARWQEFTESATRLFEKKFPQRIEYDKAANFAIGTRP